MDVKEFDRIFQADRDFPLNVRFIEQETTPLHGHEFVELVIIVHGYGMHLTPFSSYPIESGDVLVIPRGGIHGYEDLGGLALMNVLFDPDRLPIPLLDFHKLPGFNALFGLKNDFCEQNRFYPRFTMRIQDMRRIRTILRFMREECDRMLPGNHLCLMGYFMSLLGNLARAYHEQGGDTRHTPANIANAMSFMKNNYSRQLGLADILKVAGMSKSSFMRNFRLATGTSPIDYLLRTRILAACELLRSPRYRIAEISDLVGFSDSDYFSRAFRKITGRSPRQYRRDQVS